MGEEDETARLATHGAHHSASAAAHTHPTHSMTGGGMAGSSTPNMGMSGGMNASMGSGMGGMETPSRDSGGSFSGALNGIAEAANGTPGS